MAWQKPVGRLPDFIVGFKGSQEHPRKGEQEYDGNACQKNIFYKDFDTLHLSSSLIHNAQTGC
jgi:hypothetical protein